MSVRLMRQRTPAEAAIQHATGTWTRGSDAHPSLSASWCLGEGAQVVEVRADRCVFGGNRVRLLLRVAVVNPASAPASHHDGHSAGLVARYLGVIPMDTLEDA